LNVYHCKPVKIVKCVTPVRPDRNLTKEKSGSKLKQFGASSGKQTEIALFVHRDLATVRPGFFFGYNIRLR